MINALKHLRSYWENCDCLASGKEGLGESFINVYKYLIRGYKEYKVNLFWVLQRGRTRGNGHKLKYRKLHVNITKRCFCCVQCQALEQIAHGGCRVSIFGSFQNPVGQGPGQPDFAVSKGLVGIDDSQINTVIKPWFLEKPCIYFFQCSPIKLILHCRWYEHEA